MTTVTDCPEVACTPEVDCNYASTMKKELRNDAYCLNGKTASKVDNPTCYNLKNSQNKTLIFLEDKRMAKFEEMTDNQVPGNEPWTQFMIKSYSRFKLNLVAIYVKGKSNNYILSCESNKKLQFKDGEPPEKIEDKDKDIWFIRKNPEGSRKTQFESFVYREHYLACDNNNELVLKELDSDITSTTFTMNKCGIKKYVQGFRPR
ncbi:interleukin-18-like isoform X2 [Monodelphis domestica]|nr:interleukin-18-like isoform X2 [Monodelphis domestica]